MQKIIPHLWFDQEAKEAAAFYASLFPQSEIKGTTTLHDTPSGTVDIVSVDLWGLAFTLIGAGPLFQFNPSVSFLVAGSTKEEISELWGKLSQGGSALMELGEYPFSEKYGWVQDKYGLSWQIVPAVMDEMMKDKDKNGLARVTETFLKMKKFDIEALKRAYRGKK